MRVASVNESSQIRRDYSESAALTRASSGQALLAAMRFAAWATAAEAGSPWSSKSSSAARNSNEVAPWRPASFESGIDVSLACGRVVVRLRA
jgi:hypothetical protein